MTPDLENLTVSAETIAGMVDMQGRKVARILAEGGAPKAAKGKRYHFLPALRVIVAHLEAKANDEFQQHRTALWANRRAESDIALARKRGALVETALVIATAVPYATAIKQRISRSSLTPHEREEILADLAGLGSVDWTAKAKEGAK